MYVTSMVFGEPSSNLSFCFVALKPYPQREKHPKESQLQEPIHVDPWSYDDLEVKVVLLMAENLGPVVSAA